MLTKTALNKLTQAVTNKVLSEARAYNQKLVESVTQEDLYEQFKQTLEKDLDYRFSPAYAFDIMEKFYPPVFTELLSCLREERKLDRLEFPCNYNLQEIVRPEVERLTADLNEFDSDSLLVEQLFEKIYPMLVEAKYIYFESEKKEPVFDLSLPVEEVESESVDFEAPYASSGNENSQPEEESYDEGDWD